MGRARASFHNGVSAHRRDELPRLVRLRSYRIDARPQLLAVEVLPLRRHLEAQEVDAHDQQGRRGCEVGCCVEAHGSASGAQRCSAMLSSAQRCSFEPFVMHACYQRRKAVLKAASCLFASVLQTASTNFPRNPRLASIRFFWRGNFASLEESSRRRRLGIFITAQARP